MALAVDQRLGLLANALVYWICVGAHPTEHL